MRLNQENILSPITPRFRKLGFIISIFILMLLMNSIKDVSGAYPSFEENVTLSVLPNGVTISAMTFQEHSFYSNLTHCWYNFYYDGFYPMGGVGSIAYQVVDFNGNIIGGEHLDLGHPSGSTDVWDFDVTIDKHGERVYIGYRFDGDMEIEYGIVNPSTYLIDLVAWSELDAVGTLHGIDVWCSDYGITASYGKMIPVNNYGGVLRVSNSTTSWIESYSTSAEAIYNTLKGTNIGNKWYHFSKVVAFGKTGLAIAFVNVDASIGEIDQFGLMTCELFDYDVHNLTGNWDANNANNAPFNYEPDQNEDCAPNFDIVGSGDGVNITAIIQKIQGTEVTRIEKTAGIDDMVISWLNNTGIIQEESVVWLATNDRKAVNAFVVNEWSNRTFHRYVYNDTTGLWTNNTLVRVPPMRVWEQSIDGSWYAKSQGFSSQESGFGNGSPMCLMYDSLNNSYGFVWFYLDAFTASPPAPAPPAFLNITLDGIVDNVIEEYGVIIIPSEKHVVETNIHNTVELFYADFEDAGHTVEFMYDTSSNVGYTTIKSKSNGTILNVAYIDDIRETDIGGNYTNLELDFIFTESCFDYYSQLMGYGYYFEGAWTNVTVSTLKYSIFNEGGIPVYSGSGNYTIYDDNDIFSIGATNDTSYAQFNVLYNKLQHMHFNVEFDINGDWAAPWGVFDNLTGGFYEYGINYWFNGEYLRGWKVRIYPSSQAVGHQHAGIDFDWVQWTVEHYIYNRTLDDYQLEQTHFLYSNFNGYDNENSVPDYHNRTSATWWIDLWFSNDDASRKVATRVNTEWYGMYEQGSAWWFGYGTFRPIIGDYSESIFYDNIYDANYSIDTTKDNVDIVEFWGRVEKVTGGDREYIMHNYLMKNKVLAQGDMLGVDTPALVETKVMDMPQTGFLSPLLKVLSDIQRMVWQGIINVIGGLGVLVDSALVAIGLPPLMSVFYNFLIGIYDVFAVIYASFFDIISWIVVSIENMIASIFVLIPRYLLFVGLLLGTFVSYYENFVLLFTGGFGGMNNFWVDYNVMQIIELYLIAIFPFVELARIEASDEPLQTLMEDVEQFFKIIMAVFSIAKDMLDTAFEIIRSIIGLI